MESYVNLSNIIHNKYYMAYIIGKIYGVGTLFSQLHLAFPPALLTSLYMKNRAFYCIKIADFYHHIYVKREDPCFLVPDYEVSDPID